MSKLGLMKDSDFKCMHDRKLPIAWDNQDTLMEFIHTIEKDVRFLESLRIMDYSLFLIILQVPKSDDQSASITLNIMGKGDLDFKNIENYSISSDFINENSEKKKKEEFLIS